jgi:hypothetical protein
MPGDDEFDNEPEAAEPEEKSKDKETKTTDTEKKKGTAGTAQRSRRGSGKSSRGGGRAGGRVASGDAAGGDDATATGAVSVADAGVLGGKGEGESVFPMELGGEGQGEHSDLDEAVLGMWGGPQVDGEEESAMPAGSSSAQAARTPHHKPRAADEEDWARIGRKMKSPRDDPGLDPELKKRMDSSDGGLTDSAAPGAAAAAPPMRKRKGNTGDADQEAMDQDPSQTKKRKPKKKTQSDNMMFIPATINLYFLEPDPEDWARVPVGKPITVLREPIDLSIIGSAKTKHPGDDDEDDKKGPDWAVIGAHLLA